MPTEIRHPRILLRAARPEDAEALKAILRDTFESTWRPQLTAAAVRAFQAEDRPAQYVGERGLEFLVAECDGVVVGFTHWRDDFLHALHVRSDHARRGVGTRLIDRAEADIARAGFKAVRLETDTFNVPSQAFYATRGYRETARYPDEEWNSGLVTILLVKPLP